MVLDLKILSSIIFACPQSHLAITTSSKVPMGRVKHILPNVKSILASVIEVLLREAILKIVIMLGGEYLTFPDDAPTVIGWLSHDKKFD